MRVSTSNLKNNIIQKRNLSLCFQPEVVKIFDTLNTDEVKYTGNIIGNNVSVNNINKPNDNSDCKFQSSDKRELMNLCTLPNQITTSSIPLLYTTDNLLINVNDKPKNLNVYLPKNQIQNVVPNNSKKINRRRNHSLSYSKTFFKNKIIFDNNVGNNLSCSESSEFDNNNNSENMNNDRFQTNINYFLKKTKSMPIESNSRSPKKIKPDSHDFLLNSQSRSCVRKICDADYQELFTADKDKNINTNLNEFSLGYLNLFFKNKIILEVDEECDDKDISLNNVGNEKSKFLNKAGQIESYIPSNFNNLKIQRPLNFSSKISSKGIKYQNNVLEKISKFSTDNLIMKKRVNEKKNEIVSLSKNIGRDNNIIQRTPDNKLKPKIQCSCSIF